MFDNVKQLFVAVGAAGHATALGASLFEYQMAEACENAPLETKKKLKDNDPKITEKQMDDFIDRVKMRCKYYK